MGPALCVTRSLQAVWELAVAARTATGGSMVRGREEGE